MRNAVNAVAAFLIAASAAACAGEDGADPYDDEGAATPSLTDVASARPAGEAVLLTSRFRGPADDATAAAQAVTGTLRALRTASITHGVAGEGANLRLEVSIDGLSRGDHAWHIHSGPCNEQAPIVVALSRTEEMTGLTQSLTADGTGHTEGTVTVPFDDLSPDELATSRYSVRVHARGGADHGRTVVCADLAGGA